MYSDRMKIYRKLISLALVVPIFLLAIFCCCIEKAAFAQPQKEFCHSHEDADRFDHSDPHSSKDNTSDSDCCSCPRLLGESGNAVSLQAALTSVDFHHFQQVMAFVQFFNPPTERFFSFYSPPKLLVASVPLYLKNSVFRL